MFLVHVCSLNSFCHAFDWKCAVLGVEVLCLPDTASTVQHELSLVHLTECFSALFKPRVVHCLPSFLYSGTPEHASEATGSNLGKAQHITSERVEKSIVRQRALQAGSAAPPTSCACCVDGAVAVADQRNRRQRRFSGTARRWAPAAMVLENQSHSSHSIATRDALAPRPPRHP